MGITGKVAAKSVDTVHTKRSYTSLRVPSVFVIYSTPPLAAIVPSAGILAGNGRDAEDCVQSTVAEMNMGLPPTLVEMTHGRSATPEDLYV